MKKLIALLLVMALLLSLVACSNKLVEGSEKTYYIIGYAKNTVHSYIQQKRIFPVQISGKYILPKTALVDFLVGDFAFEIVHKSTWHMNTILLFVEKK